MKNYSFLIGFIILPYILFSQTPNFNQTINIDQTFTNDTEIFPFSGASLYGAGISGNVTFYSDSSYVRVILKDSLSLDYLIYESNPMLDTLWSFTYSSNCEETCFLDNYNPTSLSILVQNASIYVNQFLYSISPSENIVQLQIQAKHNKDLEKIDKINAFNRANKFYWLAGETYLSKLFFNQKKALWGEKFNSGGLEYYTTGLFEFYYVNGSIFEPTYDVVSYFDWRTRHDANLSSSYYYDDDPDPYETSNGWMTQVKCQSGCWDPISEILMCIPDEDCLSPNYWKSGNGCWAFSSVAVVEALANIYYNQHLDLNLSEQDILTGTGIGNNGSQPDEALDYFINPGVVDELCFPYSADDGNISLKCAPSEVEYQVNIDHYTGILPDDAELIKKHLIEYGPMVVNGFVPTSFENHAMAMVGFDIIKEGDYVYFDPLLGHIYIPEDDPRIGDTYWIFKDSGGVLGTVNNGYFNLRLTEFPSSGIGGNGYYYLDTQITIDPSETRQCNDEDNDGYYNWGIGDPPSGCYGERDGNDNNSSLGPINENGFCKIIDTYNFSFENSFDEWKQTDEDEQDWRKHAGPADYIYSTSWGPEEAYDGDYYIYLYGNLCSQPYETAIIESPPIDFSDVCSFEISFAFHKETQFGGAGSALEVQVSSNDGESWATFWGKYGDCDGSYICNDWNTVTLTVPSNINKVRFLAKTGISNASSNISIDDITFTKLTEQEELIVEGELILDSDYHACDNIIIKPGAKLYIKPNCTLYMPSSKKIIVERTGWLLVHGGKITGESDSFWSGIELWGENGVENNLSNQGQVVVNQGGTIENAVIGIQTIKTVGGEYNYNYSGGIVKSNDGNFINNQIAILFFPYENYGSISNLNNCTFEVNDEYLGVAPSALVSMDNINGVQFKNAKFNDFRSVSITERLTGIYSIDARFTVLGECPGSDPCEECENTEFNGLKYGIRALRTATDQSFSVENTDFINTLRGIYASGADELSITVSNFEAINLSGPVEPENYGVFIENCNAYEIEDNNFFNTDAQQIKGIGLVVSNSGPEPNLVYNNTFDQLAIGLIAQLENRNEGGETGLLIQCNDFNECEYDITVTGIGESPYLGIQRQQGANLNDAKAPAGNTFSYTWNNDESDYYNENNDIIYWYHQYDGGYNVKPVRHSKPQVNPLKNNQYPLSFDPETACPSHICGDGGGTTPQDNMETAEQKSDSIQILLNLLVDGGDTDALASEIQSSFPPEAWDLYLNLMGKSPYLSDSVLKNAINKENVLPPELITEVLVANPQSAKSDAIISEIENRTIPLSADMKEDIMLNWYIAGAKESLESKLSAYKVQRSKALNDLIRSYRNDTISQSPNDSIIEILTHENSLWAKYKLAYEYLNKGEIVLANNIMTNIPISNTLSSKEIDDYQNHLGYFNIYKSLKQDHKTWNNTDSAQLEILYSIANEPGKAGVYARNVLIFYDNLNYEEEIIFPSFEKSSSIIPIPEKKLASNNNLKVHPNPANNYFIVWYELNSNFAEATINISDVMGRLVISHECRSNADYVIFPSGDMANGTYIVQLIVNGKEISSQKLSIRK